jgi:hypothetical protein
MRSGQNRLGKRQKRGLGCGVGMPVVAEAKVSKDGGIAIDKWCYNGLWMVYKSDIIKAQVEGSIVMA